MQKSQVRIEYFGDKGEVRFKIVHRHQLPALAGTKTFWRVAEMENEEMERKGKTLKAKIAKRLDNPFAARV